jgi:homoserine O-acetyltransferase/O-succinyltransferase
MTFISDVCRNLSGYQLAKLLHKIHIPKFAYFGIESEIRDSMKLCKLNIPGPFRFEAGESLEGMEIVFHCSGHERREGEKVIWICHALTANSDPEDWWPQMVGSGKLIDTDRYFVVCVNMLCSPYGSAGPASRDASGRPYLMSFPRTTVRDMVNANILVRKYLGIGKIDLLVGPSIGGFQAYEWAVMEPAVIEKAVFLATEAKCSAYLTAYNEAQRMALCADSSFMEAASLEGGRKGLECARAIAMLSYRTYDGYVRTQTEADPDALFADRAASYQRYQGKKLADRFDAYSYWYLTYALDSHNVGRGRGGEAEALSRVRARCLVLNIDSDCLFPPESGRRLAALLPDAEYVQISSAFGHDGFLIEFDALAVILKDWI